jgi:hypothetical protein
MAAPLERMLESNNAKVKKGIIECLASLLSIANQSM